MHNECGPGGEKGVLQWVHAVIVRERHEQCFEQCGQAEDVPLCAEGGPCGAGPRLRMKWQWLPEMRSRNEKTPVGKTACGGFCWFEAVASGQGRGLQNPLPTGHYMPMPPMPPMPPMSGMPPPPAPSSFGESATMHSVVSISEDTEAAFCSAVRVTLVGSRMPISIMSP